MKTSITRKIDVEAILSILTYSIIILFLVLGHAVLISCCFILSFLICGDPVSTIIEVWTHPLFILYIMLIYISGWWVFSEDIFLCENVHCVCSICGKEFDVKKRNFSKKRLDAWKNRIENPDNQICSDCKEKIYEEHLFDGKYGVIHWIIGILIVLAEILIIITMVGALWWPYKIIAGVLISIICARLVSWVYSKI